MEPNENPQIMLNWEVMWCPRHIMPYYRYQPQGLAAVAMIKLFEAAVQLPAISDFAKGDANKIEDALVRFKPICCFLGKAVLDRIYKEVLEGK